MISPDAPTPTTVTSRDGTEIGFFTTGHGPPLLLVHGALGDHTRWDVLRPHLEPLFTVHAMDRRGRGASGDHPDYDVAREFEDVAAVIDAVADLSGTSVDVCGSSAGASFAIAAASLTSSIRRLVLFEPPTRETMAALPAGLADRLDVLLAAGDREGVLTTAYRELVGLPDASIEHLRAQPEWSNRLAAAHTIVRELRIPPDRFFDAQQAAHVTVPSIVLIGSETPDRFRASSEAVAAALPQARVALLEGQGHGAELLAPELVAGEVLAFLRSG
jgi:pimeloyl-ACP methyl ester carboxylesterase